MRVREARFYEYVTSGTIDKSATSDNLAIYARKAGDSLDPALWSRLAKFAVASTSEAEEEAQIEEYGESEFDLLLRAFGECIENVKQHAYAVASRPWFALALRGESDRAARAVIVDLGVGIPKSIRKTKGEKFVRKILAPIFGQRVSEWANVSDWHCLMAASQGQRTETGRSHRGKGLKGLRERSIKRKDAHFHIMAGRSMVTWGNGMPEEKKLEFLPGTIICFETAVP